CTLFVVAQRGVSLDVW
nr:immunoglobulin heavy chain junction region [Macaca mulatta]MOV49780.1 immunoglobulin heavy chain junction region [Macaca mulatta]MOV51026.1 immunoglobulin heavy chain junction region [Macaca mulatta]